MNSFLKKRGKTEHTIVRTVFVRSLVTYVLNATTWAIGTIVDGIIIGNYLGVEAMAAYGMIWPVTLLFGLIGGILSDGSRIRDDCKSFNLPEQYAMRQVQEDDPTKNVGIRMVMKMSREVQYLSTMSTNNLIIRI